MNATDWITLIGWGSPIGLGVFFAGGSLALYLLAMTAKLYTAKKD